MMKKQLSNLKKIKVSRKKSKSNFFFGREKTMPRKHISKNVDELGRPEETMSCNATGTYITSRHAIKPKYSGQDEKNCDKKLFCHFNKLQILEKEFTVALPSFG